MSHSGQRQGHAPLALHAVVLGHPPRMVPSELVAAPQRHAPLAVLRAARDGSLLHTTWQARLLHLARRHHCMLDGVEVLHLLLLLRRGLVHPAQEGTQHGHTIHPRIVDPSGEIGHASARTRPPRGHRVKTVLRLWRALQEIRSVKDKPFYCQSSVGTRFCFPELTIFHAPLYLSREPGQGFMGGRGDQQIARAKRSCE